MSYATVADVEISLGRPLSAEETTRAEGLLDRVENRINRRIADLADQIIADSTLEAVVVEVEADAVARVLRNPEGYKYEQDGDYAYTRDTAAASGMLQLTTSEWGLLGLTSGAFTITPYLAVPDYEPDSWISTTEHL